MIKPIHRIPLEIDSPPLHQIVQGELEGKDQRNAAQCMIELVAHSKGNEEHILVTLDWAMQIRESMGMDWGNAIDAAMTLYFG